MNQSSQALPIVTSVPPLAARRLRRSAGARGLGRRLTWAAIRMTVQLLLVGMILEWPFALREPLPIVAIALVMAAVAGFTAVGRSGRRFHLDWLGGLVSVMGGAFVVTGVAVIWIVDVDPWYEPQYLIPMLGMVLGNALDGVSLGFDRFAALLVERRDAIEADLALGATRWEAVHVEVREAIRTGMIPITNSMLVMGVVSPPGMMTGQILAGAAPADAVMYQIVIVFMIAAAVALSTLMIVLFSYRVLLSPAHRLRAERLRVASES